MSQNLVKSCIWIQQIYCLTDWYRICRVENAAASWCQMKLSYLTSAGLMPSFQSVYWRHHSTETVVQWVLEDILLTLDHGEFATLTMVDLSVAFDKGPRYLSRGTCNVATHIQQLAFHVAGGIHCHCAISFLLLAATENTSLPSTTPSLNYKFCSAV